MNIFGGSDNDQVHQVRVPKIEIEANGDEGRIQGNNPRGNNPDDEQDPINQQNRKYKLPKTKWF